jgi:hypothetical protein
MATSTLSDRIPAIGTQAAQPASGRVIMAANEVAYPFFQMTFTLDAARVSVTDGAASGSFGALKLFDFNEAAVAFLGCRQDYTRFAEGSALTTGAGDAAFVLGVGTVAVAAAADGALSGTSVNIGAATSTITLSGGTGTGTQVTGTQSTAINGTATASDIVLNFSGTAATIDANSTIDVTGTITITGVLLGDD